MYKMAICFLALTVLWGCGSGNENKTISSGSPSLMQSSQTVVVGKKGQKTHRVKRGQFLRWIADEHNVGWEAMLLVNEGFLKTKYEEVCGDLSSGFRNRKGDRGRSKGGQFYCNDRYNRPYSNTLRPGWELIVPAATASLNVEAVVADIKGDKIALVIDDTGSMTDDRQKVGTFYLAAFRKYQKQLAGVWLYAEGKVRKYKGGGVEFLTDGDTENTFGALTAAAREKPDMIVLVTDEPGDDWQWDKVSDLPPVIAHCLPDQGEILCRENLQHLAQKTRGQYVEGIK